METAAQLAVEAPYFLAPHVYLCVCGRHAVLMDLLRDKYLSVEPAGRLADWVRGWPAPRDDVLADSATAGGPGTGATGNRSLVARLLAQGMLVTDGRVGRAATPLTLPAARQTLLEFELDVPPVVGPARLGRFALAWAAARMSLKLRPIHSIVDAVRARRERHDLTRIDPQLLKPLIRAFVHLRPLFYTVRGACLLDSLTLVQFLAGYDMFPQWVFGVRTAPFHAHCWVQHGELLLNDLPDRIGPYSPIMMV